MHSYVCSDSYWKKKQQMREKKIENIETNYGMYHHCFHHLVKLDFHGSCFRCWFASSLSSVTTHSLSSHSCVQRMLVHISLGLALFVSWDSVRRVVVLRSSKKPLREAACRWWQCFNCLHSLSWPPASDPRSLSWWTSEAGAMASY